MKNQSTKQKFHALVKTMDPLVKAKDGKVKGGVLIVKSERQLMGDSDFNLFNCGNCSCSNNVSGCGTTEKKETLESFSV